MSSKSLFIYELPYTPRRKFCGLLDTDHKWEELGEKYMKVDDLDLKTMGLAYLRKDGSPTKELLDRFGERNGTVHQLFLFLSKMDYQKGMMVLLPYVNKKYHELVRNRSTYTSESGLNFSKASDFPSKSLSGATAFPTDSSFSCDSANVNTTLRALTIQPKMNSLNQQNNGTNQKKSPDKRNVRAEAANCVESVTDNCASEKIRNVRKSSQPSQPGPNNVKLQEKLAGDMLALEKSLPAGMKISYREMQQATANFDSSRILGRGGFGAVYRGDWKAISVAIKRLIPKEGRDNVSQYMLSLKQSLNEMFILKSCPFDHILPLYGVSLDGSEPCLVYQLMVNGSLEDRLLCKNKMPPLTWLQRSHIAECTAKGLNYLHTTPGKPLVHGDIKSANILLDQNMDAKIGDFGLAREGPDCQDTHVKVSKLCGTQCYLPPEYLRHRQLSSQVDIYCYGIVLLEMATGLRPYVEKRNDSRLLIDYVKECQDTGLLDTLRDSKAGEENMLWFLELIRIGQECSHKEKKKRRTAQEVLTCFTKIKEEESIMNMKARKLSNEANGMVDNLKLKELSPRGLEMYYELLKEKNAKSENANLLPNPTAENTPLSPAALDVPDPSGAKFQQIPEVRQINKPATTVMGDVEIVPNLLLHPEIVVSPEDQASNIQAPLPNLSVFGGMSCTECSTEETTSRICEGSCCSDYSEDSVLQS